MLKIDKEKFPSFEVMPFSVKDTIFSENLPDNKVVNVSLAHDYKDPIILIEFFQPQPNNDTYFHLFNQDKKIRLNLEEDQLKKVDETTKEEYLSLFCSIISLYFNKHMTFLVSPRSSIISTI